MNTLNPSANTQTSLEASQIRDEIKAKWDKFSDQELTSLKNKDHLVTQVAAKYSLEKTHAQRDVDALLKGREIRHQA
jgi:hypothetical protein